MLRLGDGNPLPVSQQGDGALIGMWQRPISREERFLRGHLEAGDAVGAVRGCVAVGYERGVHSPGGDDRAVEDGVACFIRGKCFFDLAFVGEETRAGGERSREGGEGF